MAVNPPKGKSRIGAIKKRDQVYNPKTKRWTKADPEGKFMNQKADAKPFKGVRKHK
jgi:hypothetical protein